MTEPMAHPILAQLCAERYGRLVALASMLLGSRDGAEDLVHEALIAVFSRHRNFPNTNAAEGYVRRAIATRFLDKARRDASERSTLRRHSSRVTETVMDPEPGDPHLESLVRQLPPRVRACIVLRFLDDLSIADTAAALGLSEGAVKRYVSDGLAALNKALGTSDLAVDGDVVRVEARRRGNE